MAEPIRRVLLQNEQSEYDDTHSTRTYFGISAAIQYSWIACQLEVGTTIITFAVEFQFQIRDRVLDSSAQTTRVNVLIFFCKT